MILRISPMLKFRIVFWVVSIPLFPIVLFLAIFGLVNPFNRIKVMNRIERIVNVMCNWRDHLPMVKYHYDKAYLFETLKKSDG